MCLNSEIHSRALFMKNPSVLSCNWQCVSVCQTVLYAVDFYYAFRLQSRCMCRPVDLPQFIFPQV